MLVRDPYQRVMVLRLGALGDLVLCSAAFQAIRAAHPRAIITLLTQPAWVDFGRAMPWFDRVISDARPQLWNLSSWANLLRRVTHADPQIVYDLQGKRRQEILYTLLGGLWGRLDWSGAAWRCRYPRVWPPQPQWHFTDFLAAQLQAAGVAMPTQADYDWLDAPVDQLELPERFVLLIPGCSPNHPEKRWPAYAELARQLRAQGMRVVMIGARAEADTLNAIKAAVPAVIDLGGQTSLLQIGGVARRAHWVVGNDTGPTHIAAAVGAPTLTLFSGNVNPTWSRPQGAQTAYLQEKVLADLPVSRVMQALHDFAPMPDASVMRIPVAI